MTDSSCPPELFDPRGRVSVERRHPAPRVSELEGLRLGILDNSKWNAGALLRRVAAELERDAGVETRVTFKKPSFSSPAEPAVLAEIARECDVVVTAIGD